MQRSPRKNPAPGAKLPAEIRPYIGMPRSTHALSALAGLGLIWVAGCFNPNYATCRITCETTSDCPPDLTCLVETGHESGRCISPETTTCFPPDAGTDTTDAGPDSSEPMEAGTDGDGGPPSVLCHNNSCFTLPDAVRTNLVLLLWPSNLPAVDSTVSVWRDQSGQRNDANALDPFGLPHVISNGVHLDPTRAGSGFEIADSPSLDLASGDFAVIVVAGLASNTDDIGLFSKSDGARGNYRRIAIRWGLSSPSTGQPVGYVDDLQLVAPYNTTQPSIGIYGVHRHGDHVELRLNGAVLISDDVPAGSSTTNSQKIFLGTGSEVSPVADSIEAVIVVKGAISSTDLEKLEAFLGILMAPPA
jgi:hypothetical protein